MNKPITARVKQLENGDYVNPKGEVLQERDFVSMLVPRKIKWSRGDYMLSFQKGLENIAKMGLTGEQFSVLSFLMARTDFENYINITQQEISEELNIKRPNITRAIKVLAEKSVIKKIKKGTANYYLFNPDISFKGKSKNYGNVYQLFNNNESMG
jgi:predicted transcriptional regulator